MAPIDESIRARARIVAERHELDLIVLFGSLAAGREHPASDADFAVRSASGGPVPGDCILDLVVELGALFPGREADVSDLSRADPLFLKKIFEHAVPLHAARGAFDDARLRALHRYEDYRPMLRLEREAVRKALRDAG